ncbi:glucose-6-phosphate dehydrogenase [Ligilactobacillus ceti]|uniref:Glucose-6-phosphate 1-dehydrogenase n=1 Tax=Ligilactobacillus ceti DSM 22408 TaxID=1122146 RepID=A0A0R2KS75_9LACO|nr:glucose-6-phosphate dehydrogenase [Ligilactobacillus ceti]KRN89037.1 glucose-6-phosphate 1-dehydrogenase [Ligilactobacillus ceti DSM 22408]
MNNEQKALFIIFGGTGDLAKRKLYPSLFRLYQKGYLQNKFAVIGTARREWSDEHYRNVVKESIKDLYLSEKVADDFVSHFYYQAHHVSDVEHYKTLQKLADELDKKYALCGNRLFYLAMSPRFFGEISRYLKTENIVTDHGYNRLIIEKPFGRDLASAQILNKEIEKYFPEESVFRIDHYLGKEMIQNISAIRFGNNIFSALWNNRYIDNIQITLSEALGVEERAGYYETAGALRDMVQNHILQIVALLTMNAPISFNDVDIRREKISALKALKVYSTPEEINENFVRGQYAGLGDMKGYREEKDTAEDSNIETFVAGKLYVDNMNFSDVPIYIRTGKRMAVKTTRIDIVFKQVPTNIFKDSGMQANMLTINVDPQEGLNLRINAKEVKPGFHTESINLSHLHDIETKENIPEAYEKLLLDALLGDATNFTHWEEVNYSWRFVDAIRHVWDLEPADFPNYLPGTMGPKCSDELLAKDGNHWEFNPVQ